MNRKFLFIVFISSVLLSGCKIEFDAQSNVREDGSVERITVYNAVEPGDKEEILARYELPAGGTWKDFDTILYKFAKKADLPKQVSSYEARQTVPPGQPGMDFKRWTKKKDRAAANQFSVKVQDLLFLKRYDYEEHFEDLLKPEKIRSTGDMILEKGLTTFRAELATRIKDEKAVDPIIEKMKAKYGGLLQKYYAIVPDKGWDSPEVEALSDEMQKEFTSEAASIYLAKQLPNLDNPANRQAIAESFHATEAVMADFLNDKNDLWAQEEVFGIHGVAIFQSYDFKVRVRMPGRVVQSNSSSVEAGALTWNFTSSKLNQTLRARSEKVYLVRILAAVLLVAGLMATLAVSFQSSKKKRKKGKA